MRYITSSDTTQEDLFNDELTSTRRLQTCVCLPENHPTIAVTHFNIATTDS